MKEDALLPYLQYVRLRDGGGRWIYGSHLSKSFFPSFKQSRSIILSMVLTDRSKTNPLDFCSSRSRLRQEASHTQLGAAVSSKHHQCLSTEASPNSHNKKQNGHTRIILQEFFVLGVESKQKMFDLGSRDIPIRGIRVLIETINILTREMTLWRKEYRCG